MAPPFGLVRSSDAPVSSDHASTTGANASFTSNTSMSPTVIPALASTFLVASIGPVSMITGSEPTTASACIRAIGVRPYRSSAASEAMSRAPAPSEICEATAAVISQSGRRGASPAIFSSDVSRRGPSSWPKPSSGTISRSNRPSSMARTARWWLSERELLQLGPLDAPLLADQLSATELGDLLVAVAFPPAVTPRSRHARLRRQGDG